jgi:hypothetical protein
MRMKLRTIVVGEGESDEHRVVPLPETEKHDNHRQECSQQGGLHDVRTERLM